MFFLGKDHHFNYDAFRVAMVEAECAPLGAASRLRDVISRGNLRVFEEIAFVFERFLGWMFDRAAEAGRQAVRAEGPAAKGHQVALPGPVTAVIACEMRW